ncbi:MAG TPA: molybdenum cofactor synthesis domain-containing protein [Dermatophilaceae bacterium]|jgi:molybdenum cofactor synthesis domain-containing protein
MTNEGLAVVITCSTRAAAGDYPDRSGPIIVDALRGWGFSVRDAEVVPDGPEVGAALRTAVSGGAVLVVTTGGTGLTPTDGTPEATSQVVDRLIPGIAEAVRAAGVQAGISSAMLSRGISGVAGRTLVVNLPGSMGGVSSGLEVLEPVVVHALSQIQGGDH